MFRRLLIFAFVSSSFLGGYYLGRLPESPDIFSWAQKAYSQVAGVGEAISDASSEELSDATVGREDGNVIVTIGDKSYRLGQEETARQ